MAKEEPVKECLNMPEGEPAKMTAHGYALAHPGETEKVSEEALRNNCFCVGIVNAFFGMAAGEQIGKKT